MAHIAQETKMLLDLIVRATATGLLQTPKPILPVWVQDLPAEQRPSPPPSPCDEIVVIGFNGEKTVLQQRPPVTVVGAPPLPTGPDLV